MIKLISVNIEFCTHLKRVIPFLQNENADVICLQEVLRSDFEWCKEHFKMEGQFAPMLRKEYPCSRVGAEEELGIAFLSKIPFADAKSEYYHLSEQEIGTPGDNRRETIAQVVVWATFTGDHPYTIATTHFTWTPDGEANEAQRTDVVKLRSTLSHLPPHVLCGDMNAPRGKEIFSQIGEGYTDAIPSTYQTSVDLSLHRKASDPQIAEAMANYMIDCLFLSPGYAAHDVSLVDGVSDHMAIRAHLSRE